MSRLFNIYRTWKAERITERLEQATTTDNSTPLTGEELRARLVEIGTL